MLLGVLDFLLVSYLIEANQIVGTVCNHGGIGLEQQCVIFKFITFIAGILVCIC